MLVGEISGGEREGGTPSPLAGDQAHALPLCIAFPVLFRCQPRAAIMSRPVRVPDRVQRRAHRRKMRTRGKRSPSPAFRHRPLTRRRIRRVDAALGSSSGAVRRCAGCQGKPGGCAVAAPQGAQLWAQAERRRNSASLICSRSGAASPAPGSGVLACAGTLHPRERHQPRR